MDQILRAPERKTSLGTIRARELLVHKRTYLIQAVLTTFLGA